MAAGKRLSHTYYQSFEVTHLAKDLLGKYLVTYIDENLCSGMIIETEAYRGPDDKACHAFNHRRTARTEVMYEAGGVAYIYFCYGMHHMMNVVTGPKDSAHAVLIRALEPAEGIEAMGERRGMLVEDTRLTKGPGALTAAMGLRKELSGTSLISASSPVWIEDRKVKFTSDQICIGPRIGIDSAGESTQWPWRFFVKENKYVSAKKTCI